tara:strand:+ start:394 stop:654 length:261 start_codon:yes stop_codon:yes gene_type:complete
MKKERKPLAKCIKCNRAYKQIYKKKKYCYVHLNERLGIKTEFVGRKPKYFKDEYIYYPRFMWEEKNRYIHKLVKDTMAEIEGRVND